MPSKKAKAKRGEPPTDFSADRPIASSRADRLGRKSFAEGLGSRIKAWRGRDSLVIALCGEWGCGKTSLKNMVVERLQSRSSSKVDLVEFTPWEISGHGSLTANFFRELELVLGREKKSSAATQRRVTKLRAYAKLATLGGAAAKWLGKAARHAGEDSGIGIEAAGEAWAQTGEVVGQAADAHEAKSKAKDESLSELKQSLVKEMETLERPLLIVIDDIDRLTSDEIREVFQLVKANANLPNLIYLLMFDREIVCRALDTVAGNRGHEFLDKIVQVLFHVPQPPLKDVHQMLFNGLDAHLAHTGVAERWDNARWSRVWLDGIAGYFSNLRNVYRFLGSFGFHVGQMRSGEAFELNPVDLIAIEALRMFEPSFYEALSDHRTLLVGRSKDFLIKEEDAQKERIEEFERILSVVPEERRARVREISKQLFPLLFRHRHPGEDALLRDLRVGHESIFDRYFTLSLSGEDVSQADLDALLKTLGNPKDFAHVCSSLATRDKLSVAFERLDAYKDSLPESIFPDAISDLCDVGDSLPYKERLGSAFDFKFDSLTHAWRLIYFSLKRIDDVQRRFELLRDGITASRAVRLSVLIANHEQRLERRSEHDFLIAQENVPTLQNLAVERLRSAAADGRLRKMPQLEYLLWNWRDGAGDVEVRTWVAANLQNSTDALWFLRTVLNVMRRESDRVEFIRYINLKTVEMFADTSLLEQLTRELKAEELSKDDVRALRAFRQSLVWRKEGKPDGYHGEHMRGKNPLAEDS